MTTTTWTRRPRHWARWMTVGLLGASTLAGCATTGPANAPNTQTRPASLAQPTQGGQPPGFWDEVASYLSTTSEARMRRGLLDDRSAIPPRECIDGAFLGSPDARFQGSTRTSPSCWEPMLSVDLTDKPHVESVGFGFIPLPEPHQARAFDTLMPPSGPPPRLMAPQGRPAREAPAP